MTLWAINKLKSWAPESRQLWAMRILIWSIVLGILNIVVWAFRYIPDTVMIAITLVLSWAAITVTMADIVIGTDVRVQQEDQSD